MHGEEQVEPKEEALALPAPAYLDIGNTALPRWDCAGKMEDVRAATAADDRTQWKCRCLEILSPHRLPREYMLSAALIWGEHKVKQISAEVKVFWVLPQYKMIGLILFSGPFQLFCDHIHRLKHTLQPKVKTANVIILR